MLPKKLASLATAGLVITGLSVGMITRIAVAKPVEDGPTTCEEMPAPWTASNIVEYDWDSKTVILEWDLGEAGEAEHRHIAATISEKAECGSQPGLEEFIKSLRDGERESRKASCRDLKTLVKEIRAENKGARGKVKVTREADKRAARQNPTSAHLADSGALDEKLDSAGRTIDIDQADRVLKTSCSQFKQ